MHLNSLDKGREYLKNLHRRNETIGTIHTLGALHIGHAALIAQSAKENTNTIVTIYPNKIQLFPGTKYKHNLLDDVKFAINNGATAVISTNDKEMFTKNYRTFIDQGMSHTQLNSSIFPFATRGQITGSIRWINFTQPTKSYFGLKDIEQSILMKRAVQDLLINTEIVHVPCVRFKGGVPVSSRLINQEPYILQEIEHVYMGINKAREQIMLGQIQTSLILNSLVIYLNKKLKHFDIIYSTIVDLIDFKKIDEVAFPFILHVGIKYGQLTHFDGLIINNKHELANGVETIWIDK